MPKEFRTEVLPDTSQDSQVSDADEIEINPHLADLIDVLVEIVVREITEEKKGNEREPGGPISG